MEILIVDNFGNEIPEKVQIMTCFLNEKKKNICDLNLHILMFSIFKNLVGYIIFIVKTTVIQNKKFYPTLSSVNFTNTLKNVSNCTPVAKMKKL